MHTPLVARCVRGLESAVAAEVLSSGLGVVTDLRHREVHFRTSRPAPQLRTADDVFLFAAERPDVGTTKHDLHALAELAELTDADRLLSLRRALTKTPHRLTGIDVSASFLGRRTFSRYDAEDVIGPALARQLGVPYHSRRTGAASPPGHWGWRLTLDGTRATLMLRINDRPLHRRAYKRHTIPGTLHPPLAAAMAAMADIRPGHVVLDPCCGAGTLLIEAALAQPEARFHGFDLSPDAVTAARANAVDLPVGIRRSDAARLPLPDGEVDRVLCNPPWGSQAHARGLVAADPTRWWTELRRVLAPDGTAVLLLPDPDTLAGALRHDLTPLHIQRIRVSGAQPYIVHLASTDRARRRRATSQASGGAAG
ncbi:methyltransferase domain-containing protein [Streptomyces sporangiiformans]|uniref:Methyltransferase domain-containing protein n=1 Tax=Streptomyces sporangiiformans TaxID=2315329 RepID=A0A505DGU5_9ACTN|nr:methyltransferase domain-containing protein [Streptomyces sporangiiformans]TPQ22357.1 methyltransferase domain-containing protein [Streptomyces sporangiiformans]